MKRLVFSFVLCLLVAMPVLSSQRLRIKPRGVAGGACTVGTTPCVDNISSSAPANGASQTINGQNFIKLNKTGWSIYLSDAMSGMEGSDGSSVRVISTSGADPASFGYQSPSGDDNNNGITVTAVKLMGSSSARFRSAFTNPVCSSGVAFNSAFFYYNNAVGSDNDVYFGAWWRWDPYVGWPDNFQKLGAVQNIGFLFQPANGMTTSAGWMPTTFRVGASASEGSITFNPDGGAVEANKWYRIDYHAKTNATTDFTAYVNGEQIVSMSPTANDPGNDFHSVGLINGCGSVTWGLDHWVDGIVWSTQEPNPHTQVWLCPSSADDTITEMRSNCVWQFPETISETQWVGTHRTTGSGVTITAGTRYYVIFNNGLLTGNFPVTVS